MREPPPVTPDTALAHATPRRNIPSLRTNHRRSSRRRARGSTRASASVRRFEALTAPFLPVTDTTLAPRSRMTPARGVARGTQGAYGYRTPLSPSPLGAVLVLRCAPASKRGAPAHSGNAPRLPTGPGRLRARKASQPNRPPCNHQTRADVRTCVLPSFLGWATRPDPRYRAAQETAP